jgi:SARP family transcriptional regulator, regulator of embCAB operon
MSLRIYLAGLMCIEAGDILLEERAFPGKQGRLAFAYLVARRGHAVPRDELAGIIWPDALPRSWETALSAVVSNLRALLGRAGLPRAEVIATSFGCYQLRLPAGAWIDIEVAADSLDRAEGAQRVGNPMEAYGWAGAAASIARRPFLAGEAGAWVETQRHGLRNILVRALDCLTAVFLWNGEFRLAERVVEEALTLEPFRETGYQQLMRVHAAMGNRAEAIRAYERCRRLLADELGVDPSPRTEGVYLEILKVS